MDGRCEELLPRARLANQQHGGARRRDLIDLGQHALDGDALAHDVRRSVQLFDLLLQVHVLREQLLPEASVLVKGPGELEVRSLASQRTGKDLPQQDQSIDNRRRPRALVPHRAEGQRAHDSPANFQRNGHIGFGAETQQELPVRRVRRDLVQAFEADQFPAQDPCERPGRLGGRHDGEWRRKLGPGPVVREDHGAVRVGEFEQAAAIEIERFHDLLLGPPDLVIDALRLEIHEPCGQIAHQSFEIEPVFQRRTQDIVSVAHAQS